MKTYQVINTKTGRVLVTCATRNAATIAMHGLYSDDMYHYGNYEPNRYTVMEVAA